MRMKKKMEPERLSAQEERMVRQLRGHPELAERFETILGLAANADSPLKNADEVEGLLVEELRPPGRHDAGKLGRPRRTALPAARAGHVVAQADGTMVRTVASGKRKDATSSGAWRRREVFGAQATFLCGFFHGSQCQPIPGSRKT